MMNGETEEKTYETVCILNPTLSTEAIEEKITSWKSTISELGGELAKLSRWGKKTLAYEVKKFHQGYYIMMHIQGPHAVKDELERQFKISEDVIKFQTIKLNPVQLKVSQGALERFEASTVVAADPDAEGAPSTETTSEQTPDTPVKDQPAAASTEQPVEVPKTEAKPDIEAKPDAVDPTPVPEKAQTEPIPIVAEPEKTVPAEPVADEPDPADESAPSEEEKS
jgi:small subunit ribosomal protein S6